MPARLASVAGARARAARDRRRAAPPRRPLRRRAGDARATAGARDAARRWRRPASPPTTGCRTRWPAARRCGGASTRCGRRSTRRAWCSRLLSDRGGAGRRRGRASSTADEQAQLLWAKPARGAGSAPWSLADAVLVDEAADLVEREPSLGHVVARRGAGPLAHAAAGGRAAVLDAAGTVLGDIAQARRPGPRATGPRRSRHLGKPRRARRGADAAATACRRRSSSSPAGCCRRSMSQWAARRRCARRRTLCSCAARRTSTRRRVEPGPT